MPKCTAVRRPFRIRSSVVYGGSSMEKKHVWLTWIRTMRYVTKECDSIQTVRARGPRQELRRTKEGREHQSRSTVRYSSSEFPSTNFEFRFCPNDSQEYQDHTCTEYVITCDDTAFHNELREFPSLRGWQPHLHVALVVLFDAMIDVPSNCR